MIWRNNGLSIVLFGLFLFTMSGQTVTGWIEHNHAQADHGESPITLASYLESGHFWEATGENWESEFLQMSLFVLLTMFLYQKGSAESKRPGVLEEVDLDPGDFRHLPDAPGPVRAGGWRLLLYEHSLGLFLTMLFVVSMGIHAAGGLREFNADQMQHHRPPASMAEYVSSTRFWFESFQNWQSEFLSLGVMVAATVFLRQRGSAESKPVFAAHGDTGKG